MIYMMTISDVECRVVATVVFDIYKGGIDVVRYRLGEVEHPACKVWELMERLGEYIESTELDERSSKDVEQLKRILAFY